MTGVGSVFVVDCRESEIPVVPPLAFPDSATFSEVQGTGIYYSVFPKVGGRILDEMSDAQLKLIGRLLGRLHSVRRRSRFQYCIKLTAESYGFANIQYLKENKLIPPNVYLLIHLKADPESATVAGLLNGLSSGIPDEAKKTVTTTTSTGCLSSRIGVRIRFCWFR